MLDSQVFPNATQARVDVQPVIEWTSANLDYLSVKTVENCWNQTMLY